MALRSFVLIAAAMATIMSGPAGAAQSSEADAGLTEQTRKMGGVMPAEQLALDFRHIDLKMKIDPAQKRIEGDATLTFEAKEAVSTLYVDLYPDYDIASVSLDGESLSQDAYENPEGQLRIRLPAPLAAGDEIKARIVYAGTPHESNRPPWEGGVVWSETEDGSPWVGSTLWGAGCDLLWPCIDHPTRKPAMADLHYTVPAPLVAPANGEFMGMTEEDGWRTYSWRARSPHTYGVIINVGPYVLIEEEYESRYGNTFPMMFWHLPGEEEKAAELFEEFPQILDFFETYIGPYPWADQKMGVVVTPFSGMEHQTINGYGSNYVKNQYGYDTLLQHEFAHEYFANQLSNDNYDDLWLHEGFGSYMQPLYVQSRNGALDYYSLLRGTRTGIMNEQPLVTGKERSEKEVYVAKTGPRGDIYAKGSFILHSLRMLIGDEDFFETLTRLVYGRPDPKPGNFEPQLSDTQDYIDIVNEVTGRDLGWFFDVYLYQAEVPELVESRENGRLNLEWKVPQDLPFPMPVDVEIDGEVKTVSMKNGRGSLRVADGARVVVDPRSKLLRYSADVEEFRAWRKAQEEKEGSK